MKQWMRAQSETFRFTRAVWGERSNFGPIAGGMYLAELLWTTSEALYQAFKGVDADQQIRIARAPHIVEESKHDAWWGAKPVGLDRLEGENVLGCLLVELRDGTVPAGAGPAFRLGAYEVRRVGMEIEQRRVRA